MATDYLIGIHLGDFAILERIGQGGMASVYRAHQGSVHRDVALKVIPLGSTDRASETFRRRFAQEAALVASLEHIHILPIYEYGITEDLAYIAMRLLRGGTLAGLLRREPLAIPTAVDLFRQFASGLRYAHRRGVIHRDLKPANIMLDDSGNALLTDFGLARLVGESLELTQHGTVVGTPVYMSPEQALGKPLDARSDIYSAGVVLYHMLVGRPPFGGPETEMVAAMFQQIHTEPPLPSLVNPAIPEAVEAVVMRALSKAPEDRHPTIEAMSMDLDRAIGRSGTAIGSTFEGVLGANDFEVTPSPLPLAALDTPRRVRMGDTPAGYTPPLGIPLEPRAELPATPRRRSRVLAIVIGGFVLATALAALGLFVAGRRTQPIASVRAGAQGAATDAIPVATEIAGARRRLGDAGFIAYVTCTQRTEYHATQAREMGDFAKRHGLPYRVYDSDGDDYNQLTQIERARADGARALILCPLNASLLATFLTSAQEAGLPLVLMSSGMPSYGGVIIAGDDYAMGVAAGRFAGEIIAREKGGRAEAVILDFPDLPNLVGRAQGLRDGMTEKAPSARVVAHAKGGTREFAATSVGELIARGQSFDVILSINDAGAFGAIAALERAGRSPSSVLVSSVDAEALARDYIEKGRFIRGSVATNREEFSRTAMGAMIKLLAGSPLPETFLVKPGQVVTR